MKLTSLPCRVPRLADRVASATASAHRIRGRALQRIRAQRLEANPLCHGPDSECERDGIVTLATQVDHVVALGNGGSDSDANRQELCASCHRVKTRRDVAQMTGGAV